MCGAETLSIFYLEKNIINAVSRTVSLLTPKTYFFKRETPEYIFQKKIPSLCFLSRRNQKKQLRNFFHSPTCNLHIDYTNVYIYISNIMYFTIHTCIRRNLYNWLYFVCTLTRTHIYYRYVILSCLSISFCKLPMTFKEQTYWSSELLSCLLAYLLALNKIKIKKLGLAQTHRQC